MPRLHGERERRARPLLEGEERTPLSPYAWGPWTIVSMKPGIRYVRLPLKPLEALSKSQVALSSRLPRARVVPRTYTKETGGFE